MQAIVTNHRGVPLEAAGRRFPPRSRTVVAVGGHDLARLRSRPGIEVEAVPEFPCTGCDRTFASERGLVAHRRAKHEEV